MVGHDDERAFLRHQIRNRLADAMRAGAHVGKLPFQLIVHVCLKRGEEYAADHDELTVWAEHTCRLEHTHHRGRTGFHS